ncbi:uncharacterized protein LOC142772057 [Rhipicephalus microplus]|uniref:uncharacterized protein LOC142772057 n=1 Tax=Rhipicephalus microplus TaxID=6941 RepID=UPI003F6CA04F
MAESSEASCDSDILSTEYMTLLQRLCRLTNPTVAEISAIFTGDFRRALGGARARPSVRAEAASAQAPSGSRATPSTSRGSKKRFGKPGSGKGRGRKSTTRVEPEEEDEPNSEDVGFARPCTWEPDRPCWLRGELEQWNNLLARNFFELKEHLWSEFTFTGYGWSEINVPEDLDTLRVSLLINFLLRRHRCLNRVLVDFEMSNLEHAIFWDGIKNGAAAVTSLEYKATVAQQKGMAPKEEYQIWASSLSSLKYLHSLHLTRVFMNLKISEELADFMEETTTLETLSLNAIKPQAKVVAGFLEALAMNKSIKNFYVSEEFAKAEEGRPLAYFLKNHKVIHTLEVKGGGDCVPSAILRAAMLSRSLRCLNIHACKLLVVDIDEISNALSRGPPDIPPGRDLSPEARAPPEARASAADGSSLAAKVLSRAATSSTAERLPDEGTSAAVDEAMSPESPTPTTSHLEKLGFFDIANSNPLLEQSYASLIGGVLLGLTLSSCDLEETFATAAAAALVRDSRLKTLDVQHNPIPFSKYAAMIDTLKVNETIETLAFTVAGMPASNLTAKFFQAIHESNAASRLKISWVDPRGSDFAQGVDNCRTSLLLTSLSRRPLREVGPLLDTVKKSSNNFAATIRCTATTLRPVVDKLITICRGTKFLNDLKLSVDISEQDGLSLIRSLERNRSVRVLELSNFLFRKRAIRALGQLVQHNQCINELTISIQKGKQEWNQMKSVCRELKEAVLSNRALTVLNVEVANFNLANDFTIKDTLRRNMMYVNEASYFVKGSNDRGHATAFEALKKSYSLKKVVQWSFNLKAEQAMKKIEDAHRRYAANYFTLTGVVKDRVRCEPDPDGLATLEEFRVNVLAHLCNFLSINDVLPD